MRLSALALSLILALSPSLALADNNFSLGSFPCRQAVPCDASGSATVPANQLAAIGNACLAQNMGGNAGSLIDESAGVDGNGCLTVKSENIPVTGGTKTVPVCCLKPTSPASCIFTCSLVAQ